MARLENPAEVVVAVAAVRGSETAEVLATQNLITRGMKGFRLAKHARISRQSSGDRLTLRNEKGLDLLLMVLSYPTPKQSSS